MILNFMDIVETVEIVEMRDSTHLLFLQSRTMA